MKVLNIWGGPGSGKSTTAAGVFYEIKRRGLEAELVTEYAKDMVWEGRHNILEDQIYIFAKQQRRISRLRAHNLQWVITDSPIAMGLCYTTPAQLTPAFVNLVMQVFASFDNHNYFVSRTTNYNPVGRNQSSQQEAQEIDCKIKQLLDDHSLAHKVVPGADQAVQFILKDLGL